MFVSNMQIHTANVQSFTPSKGTSGAEKDVYVNSFPNMACRVLDTAATWKVYYMQKQQQVSHSVFTNQGPVVLPGYKLIWGTRTLLVVGVQDKGGKGNITQIDCWEIF